MTKIPLTPHDAEIFSRIEEPGSLWLGDAVDACIMQVREQNRQDACHCFTPTPKEFFFSERLRDVYEHIDSSMQVR